jgi:protein gp37
MGANTAIQWTDHSFNPWIGCSRISPGCVRCYAEAGARRWGQNDLWRRRGPRRVTSSAYWRKPRTWNREAERAGQPLKVFCASWADVFEDHPDVTEARARLWDLIEDTPWLRWQLLTKRPENAEAMVPWGSGWPPWVWLGASAENQDYYDGPVHGRGRVLAQTGAAVKFLSCEPLIGPLTLDGAPGIDWVIVGGESGGHARPAELAWLRSLVAECRAAGTAVFVKQAGKVLGQQWDAGPKGDQMDRWPPGIRVRQFPADPATAALACIKTQPLTMEGRTR